MDQRETKESDCRTAYSTTEEKTVDTFNSLVSILISASGATFIKKWFEFTHH